MNGLSQLFIKLNQAANRLTHVPRALRLIWAAAPRWTVMWVILLVIQGLLPAIIVYLTPQLVDNLAMTLQSSGSWEQLRTTLILAALMAGITLLMTFFQSILEWVRTAQSEFIQDHLDALIHDKAIAADLAFYESAEYHDRLRRAGYEAKSRPLSLLENIGNVLQNSITLVTICAILIPYGLWLPLLLVMSTLPALFVVVRYSWLYHQWWEQTTSTRRRTTYYNNLLTLSSVAAELRLFDLGNHFKLAYQRLRFQLRTERLAMDKQQGLAKFTAGTLAMLAAGVPLAWIVWRAVQGLATLGDLALFYQAFSRGQTLMRTLLGNIGQIYSNSLFLGNLFEFLDLEPQLIDPAQPSQITSLNKGIHFRQVTFCYPGSDRPALQDFDLTIPAGQIIAIVGANGAGKSTLVKLICRFYEVESGRVEWDGCNIRNLSLADLRRHISVLFQAPVPYQLTAADNIALGDLPSNPSLAYIEAAAQGAGAHEIIEQLPKGYETQLGKWFTGGTDLSGGEWQRVALARAFLRRAPLVILDEPTSFMDSWAEADWLARFRTLVKGRTAIIITHRFTTAMQADIIYVMDQGQIVESGSHAELLAQQGRYARSWRAQMQAGPDRLGSEGPPAGPLSDQVGQNGQGQLRDISEPQMVKDEHV